MAGLLAPSPAPFGMLGAAPQPRGGILGETLQQKLAREMTHRTSGPGIPQQPTLTEILNGIALGSNMVPGFGDVAGLAADVNMFATQPETRTPLNVGLAGIGLLPFVPGALQGLRGIRALGDAPPDIMRMPGQGRPLGGLDPGTAFHGGPTRFAPEPDAPLGQFRADKIGSGEGAQAFGYGHYLAENPNVAEQYKTVLSQGRNASISGGGVEADVPAWLAAKIDNDGIDWAINEWRKRIGEVDQRLADPSALQPHTLEWQKVGLSETLDKLEAIKASGSADVRQPGTLITADIPDETIDQMLDWDAPVDAQEPPVREALNKFRLTEESNVSREANAISEFGKPYAQLAAGEADFVDSVAFTRFLPDMDSPAFLTAGDFYKALAHDFGGQEIVSAKLRELGIPGIKFLDATSRTKGQGTRNLVVFPGNESLINITDVK